MREIIVTSNVSDKIREGRSRGHVMLAAFVGSFLVLFVGVFATTWVLSVIGFVGAVMSLVGFSQNSKKLITYSHGHEGESILRRQLHSILSDDYIAFFGYPLKDRGDIDCVVLGPSGLYVMEAKHHNGTIHYTEGGWRQTKVGRRGTAYHGNMKKPGGQVMYGLHEVKRLLEEKHIKVFIQGVLVFTNPAVSLFVERETKPLVVYRVTEIESLFALNSNRILPLKKRESIEKELKAIAESKDRAN